VFAPQIIYGLKFRRFPGHLCFDVLIIQVKKKELSGSVHVVETTPKTICRQQKKTYLRCWKSVPNTTNCFASLTTPPTMHWWTGGNLPTLSSWPPVVSRMDWTAWFAFWSCGHPGNIFEKNIGWTKEFNNLKTTKTTKTTNNNHKKGLSLDSSNRTMGPPTLEKS
jgi:hypothetical protein